MTSRKTTSRKIERQRGALTLMMGLLLLMGSTMLTLSSVRVGVMEQRIANNELRAKEAQQAAQAGLDYALARIGQGNNIDTPPPVTATSNITYDIVLTESERDNEICVSSRAGARGDDSIEAVATECFQRQSLFNHKGFGKSMPPLVVNGGIQKVTGNPDIYPADCNDEISAKDCESIAIVSSAERSDIEEGHFNKKDPLDDDQIRAKAFASSAWEYVFGISKDRFKALAEADDPNDPQFIWAYDAKKAKNFGSAKKPVYLVFDSTAGCPKLGGDIYGVVYFESPTACRSQGWGGATIYGSVVFEGSLDKFTANSDLYNWNTQPTSEGGGPAAPQKTWTSRIPGSWRDWD
ncbi:PilX N-terminal domain-containing pilus assembly protein [Thiocapsa rosea]|uniref:PilX-like prepilin protein n=1 Tax=Thiocapsa rosea TaxID=69360 RepID=A0A495VCW4_9GAMM|nr:PilX N-terminal domain-containing pilus assembly protein [Thiocapsa rosea]RKT47241.1 PilX-like prepilin protein [Thiocapsa rosea]